MKQRLEETFQKIQDGVSDAHNAKEIEQRLLKMLMLIKESIVPLVPAMKQGFIQVLVFVCFFLAISNMAEKVPSFKTGGAFWFLDLSTPDPLYIFPVLTALTFLTTKLHTPLFNKDLKGVKKYFKDVKGLPGFGTIKNIYWGLAVLLVPLTMGLPKAIFCYWITSNIFSSAYNLALRLPRVQKFLGISQLIGRRKT